MQYVESGAEDHHASWLEIDNFSALKSLDGRSIRTSRDLLHLAREPRHDILEKTYFLKATGFNFTNLPDVLSGIELKLTMNRFGRITDETVQLCIGNNLIGDNQANLDLSPIKLFGSDTNSWNTELTIADLQDSTFGIVLRFQSHPRWPHKCSAMIDTVEIRVH
jgi:hypothetical protein